MSQYPEQTYPPAEADGAAPAGFAAWLEAIPQAILIVDDEGIIRETNQRASDLFGYAPDRLRGQPVESLIPEHLRLRHTEHRLAYAAAPHARAMCADLNIVGRSQDGIEVPIDVSLSPLADQFILVAVRDARESRARDDARRELDAGREALLAMVGHELKGQVGIISGWMGRLNRHVRSPSPEDTEAVATITAVARRIEQLARSLCDLETLESQDWQVDREPVALGVLVRRAVSEMNGTTVGLSRIEVDLPEDLPPVEADADRLALVLDNLIGNALKYSPQGTPIVVRAHRDGGVVTVTVTDHGRGIPRDQIETIFAPFHRLSGGPEVDGLGLGLTICDRIIKAHEGRIWAESDGPGKGTTLAFTLPCLPTQAE